MPEQCVYKLVVSLELSETVDTQVYGFIFLHIVGVSFQTIHMCFKCFLIVGCPSVSLTVNVVSILFLATPQAIAVIKIRVPLLRSTAS